MFGLAGDWNATYSSQSIRHKRDLPARRPGAPAATGHSGEPGSPQGWLPGTWVGGTTTECSPMRPSCASVMPALAASAGLERSCSAKSTVLLCLVEGPAAAAARECASAQAVGREPTQLWPGNACAPASPREFVERQLRDARQASRRLRDRLAHEAHKQDADDGRD